MKKLIVIFAVLLLPSFSFAIKPPPEDEKFMQEYGEQIKKAQAEEEARNRIRDAKKAEEERRQMPAKVKALLAMTDSELGNMSDRELEQYAKDLASACSSVNDAESAMKCSERADLIKKISSEKIELYNARRQNEERMLAEQIEQNKINQKNSIISIELLAIAPRLLSSGSGSEKILEISFSYKNSENGYVVWENDFLECQCEFKSGIIKERKTEMLRSHTQNLYLKIDWGELQRQYIQYRIRDGRVTCTIRVNGNKIEAAGDVYF